MATYDIRVELPDGTYRDFHVTAYDVASGTALTTAKMHAADRIRAEYGPDARIDFRGLVAFVNREVPCGEPKRLTGFALASTLSGRR